MMDKMATQNNWQCYSSQVLSTIDSWSTLFMIFQILKYSSSPRGRFRVPARLARCLCSIVVEPEYYHVVWSAVLVTMRQTAGHCKRF
jgi:hypothetical protein